MYPVDSTSFRSFNGFNRRVRFLVMHYKAANFKSSVAALTGPSVSAHYLVPDPSEKTYIESGFQEMRIFSLVDESERAWHAGVSEWGTRSNLNDTSIGIEIISLAVDNKGAFTFPAYDLTQIDAVRELAVNILERYPDITPTQVLGHSDIAPGRKSDPGAAFPWKELYTAGVGAWYDDVTQQKYCALFQNALPDKINVIAKLKEYGYDTLGSDTSAGYRNLLRAFQLHFRPHNYNGVLDAETGAALYALVEKYFPAK